MIVAYHIIYEEAKQMGYSAKLAGITSISQNQDFQDLISSHPEHEIELTNCYTSGYLGEIREKCFAVVAPNSAVHFFTVALYPDDSISKAERVYSKTWKTLQKKGYRLADVVITEIKKQS